MGVASGWNMFLPIRVNPLNRKRKGRRTRALGSNGEYSLWGAKVPQVERAPNLFAYE